jgi:hypothetical protein
MLRQHSVAIGAGRAQPIRIRRQQQRRKFRVSRFPAGRDREPPVIVDIYFGNFVVDVTFGARKVEALQPSL